VALRAERDGQPASVAIGNVRACYRRGGQPATISTSRPDISATVHAGAADEDDDSNWDVSAMTISPQAIGILTKAGR